MEDRTIGHAYEARTTDGQAGSDKPTRTIEDRKKWSQSTGNYVLVITRRHIQTCIVSRAHITHIYMLFITVFQTAAAKQQNTSLVVFKNE